VEKPQISWEHSSALGIETTVSELFYLIEITDKSHEQDGQWTCKRNVEAHSLNYFYRAKAVNIKYSECVSVALVIQYAKRVRRILLSPVACPAVLYFATYLINGTIFGKKLLNTKCVFWFSLQRLSETFLILRRIKSDIIINVHKYACKVPVILVIF
jgi:hypothetical protein